MEQQQRTLEERVRRRVWHSISQETADFAGCRQADLQKFIAHQYAMTQSQLVSLANYFRMPING